MGTTEKLHNVVALLKRSRISFSLGGSGLLYAYGLTDYVNDWDIMTDCSYSEVVDALNGVNWTVKPKTEPFASEYVLQLPDYNTEIIGSFRIRTISGTCKIPNYISNWWDDEIALSSPEAWFVAYKLMGRPRKADLLREYIFENGANHQIASVVLAEPLPQDVRAEAITLFGVES